MRKWLTGLLVGMVMVLALAPMSALAAGPNCQDPHDVHASCGAECTALCPQCVAALQALAGQLPTYAEIVGDQSGALSASAISLLEEMDAVKALTSDVTTIGALGVGLGAFTDAGQKYSDAVEALVPPKDHFRFAIKKKYEVPAGMDTPDATFTFYRNGSPVSVIRAAGYDPAHAADVDTLPSVDSITLSANQSSGAFFLPAGTYTVQETTPSGSWNMTMQVNGVEAADHTFTGNGLGRVMLAFDNELVLTASILVVDADDERVLEGAQLQMLDQNGNLIQDGKGVDAEWTSSDDPAGHKVEGLKDGEPYTLHQTVAPDGYVRAQDIIFSIDQNNNVIIEGGSPDNDNVLRVRNVKTLVSIATQEELTGAAVEDATIQLLDSLGNVNAEWASTSQTHDVYGLAIGEEYTLRVTTASDAYSLPNDTTFDLNEDGSISNYTGVTGERGVLLVTFTRKETVADPVIEASDGQKPQTVTLTCATPGAQIYYTTDGSEPDASSNLYTGPFEITATTTITARAMKDDMLPSSAVSKTVTLTRTNRALTGIEVATWPKLDYKQGDMLDLSGLSVKLIYTVTTEVITRSSNLQTETETVAFADFDASNLSVSPANGTVLPLGDTLVTVAVNGTNLFCGFTVTASAAGVADINDVVKSVEPAGGKVTVTSSNGDPNGPYVDGQVVTIEPVVNKGFHFGGWLVDGAAVNGDSLTFTIGSCNVTALFAPNDVGVLPGDAEPTGGLAAANVPQTGVGSPVVLLALLMLASACACAVVLRKVRKA